MRALMVVTDATCGAYHDAKDAIIAFVLQTTNRKAPILNQCGFEEERWDAPAVQIDDTVWSVTIDDGSGPIGKPAPLRLGRARAASIVKLS